MKRLTRRDLRGPLMLLALSVIPMMGGIVRLRSFSAPATEESARFLETPMPVLIHIVSVALYCLLGAFQFSPGFRLRWPRWHRQAGKLLAVCGVASALSGIWMTAFYPIPQSLQGSLLLVVRILVGATMVASIVVAWSSILRRDVVRHEAWMIRAYALGQGAGTQALVILPWVVLTGEVVGLRRDLLMTLAWAINIGVAEWLIRRRGRAPRPALSGVSPSTSPA